MGLYGPWKVLKFETLNLQAWKIRKNAFSWKTMENRM